ncbi:hypothetical protein UNDYM_4468 [Undibacterium sp. YM2]|uniref:phospholipase effector Tle1 domain-containing protein n=1 Tax=Undibacterium sp. YM2 TaxID=2058625 RepID=UPI001331C98C|nr:DUF2235 domain-containing protein [Undibacterium sp. YM2]BBB68721.1 hypothetical protein UNDYM_4468 [Undibacterium sp. YM2]
MTTAGNDGVDVKIATPEQLASYTKAQEQIDAFKVPNLYDAKNPNARVFVALFDGTGNDAINDPAHITNVGLFSKQLENINGKNPNIVSQYVAGPGTQSGVMGTVDGALGVTYNARIEMMYEKFERQSNRWLQENPDAKISVVSVGFSRGAEQAAGFSRIVAERGVQNILGKVGRPASNNSEQSDISYTVPALVKGGTIPQALGLFDPVATGVPSMNDRRPPDTVITGIQIRAADERRLQFPATNYSNDGLSADGRFLKVMVAGAHSDIGGGYEKNGLPYRNFNMMSQFLNGTLGDNLIKKLDVPADPDMSVIHDSSQHKVYWIKMSERGESNSLDLFGKKMEPMNPAMEPYTKNAKALGTQANSPNEIRLDSKDAAKPLPATAQEGKSSDKPAVDTGLLTMADSPSSRMLAQFREVPRTPAQPKL